MKKHILFILLFTATTFAQQSNGEITSNGKATVKVKPDVVIFKIDAIKENELESEALKALNLELDILQKFLIKTGIPAKQIKIAKYSVHSSYNSSSEKRYYTAVSDISIETKLDNKLINVLFSELQSGKYKNISLSYETSLSGDLEKKLKQELLTEAIKNARQNADNIAKALSVKITGVKSVSTGNRNDDYILADRADYGLDIMNEEPKTIFTKFEVVEKELDENITIVYEIGK